MAPNTYKSIFQSKNTAVALTWCVLFAMALLLPTMAFAADDGLSQTNTKVCTFFQDINSLLNAASIVVVTVAVIFSGYQIAFAHKRIAEVAPVLVGGVLIGAAAQVAKMVVGGSGSGSSTACQSSSGATTMLMHSLNSAVQYLQHYA
ncbi:TrbC/VirB2 family protein [Frateuria defendens]|uniref:TrbC/VirB2 family protein n=1 Tax=Frateuria defendens TaxID=2219559 RepID=UPI0007DC129B|nr:TrbC/VirB2 family protein [Frateuria defendens]